MITPTTTVGKASMVLSAVIAARRPQKRVVPTTKPTGTPTPQARMVDVTATRRDRVVMSMTSGSPPTISSTPRQRPSQSSSNGYRPKDQPSDTRNIGLWVHCVFLLNRRSSTGSSSGAFAGGSKNCAG